MIAQRFVLGAVARNVARGMVLAGAVAAAIGIAADPQRTWPALLVDGFYVMAAALGGMVFIALQYLSGASWCAGIRRIPEAMMAALPVSAALMLSLFFGRGWLYPATRSSAVTAEHATAGRALYLGTPFFFGRMGAFVIAWIVFAFLLRRTSLRQDDDPSPRHHQRMVRYSAAFTAVFAISFSLASFDWFVALDPRWTSTIFAVYMFAGLLVQAVATVTLAVVLLRERGFLAAVVDENHLHDLGKLLFAFTTFWAYIWFSQYLLIWYGNIPEEITYYVSRTGEHWIALFLLNVVVNWTLPFLVLLPRATKRHPVVLKWLAIVLLAGRWLDLYLTVTPQVAAAPGVRPADVLIVAGYAAVFFLATTRALGSVPLVPWNDPFLRESLAPRQ